MRPHELLRPSTAVLDGLLSVDAGAPGDGPALARTVPLPAITAAILNEAEGPLSELLCLPHRPGALLSDLACALQELRDGSAEPTLGPDLALHRLVPLATHALVTAAAGPRQRAAVMAYAGIEPVGAPAARERNDLRAGDLRGVADLVDQLTAEAGYVVTSREEAASA